MATLSHLNHTKPQQNLWLVKWKENWDTAFHPAKQTWLPVRRNKQVLTPNYTNCTNKQRLLLWLWLPITITIQKEHNWNSHTDTIRASEMKHSGSSGSDATARLAPHNWGEKHITWHCTSFFEKKLCDPYQQIYISYQEDTPYTEDISVCL